MFRKKVKGNPDLSFNFKDEALWKPDLYERFPVASVTAIAYDRSLSIYVCGLSNGEVHLYGSAPVHHVFVSPDTVPVNHLQIVPTAKRVVGIASNRLVVWSLEGKLTAKALSSVEIPSGTVFLGTSSRHSHAFIPYSDGTIVTFDLSRLSMSPSKVIPPPSLSDDVVMDLAHNIHNLDELLVATYASIYVWHFTSKIYGRTFNLPDQVPLHPVCLSMHPQESVFVAGTLDGRLVFWNISETEPLWVTTISELVGELKEDQVEERSLEPIFKLSWTLSDSGSSLTILGGRGGNQSRLTTLGFSSTSFLTLEQLVPEKTVVHDPSLCEDISDFVVITRENRILTLQKNSTVVIFGSEDRVDNGEASPGPLEEPFIPYQFRSSIVAGYVLECSSDIPPQFIQFNDVTSIATGGLAISKDGPDSRLSKYDPPRLLVGIYGDRILRFDDASSKYLLTEGPLASPYPAPLTSLSIDVGSTLEEPLVFASLEDASACEVQQLEFIPASLELYVIFNSGEILVWKWHHEQVPFEEVKEAKDGRFVDITSLANGTTSFQPRVLINARVGAVSVLSVSEVGFTAISYAKGSFMLIDMRGPIVMTEQMIPATESISILKFVVCKQDEKSPRKLFLALFRVTGSISLLRITKESSRWVLGERIDIPSRKGLAHPIECFLIDIMTGEDMTATAHSVGDLFSHHNTDTRTPSSISSAEFYRVTVSHDSTSCHIGWSSKSISSIPTPKTATAGLLRQKDSTTLALYGDNGSVTILSIPKLETITRFEHVIAPSTVRTLRTMSNLCSFSICTPTGVEVWCLSSLTKKFFPSITVPMEASAEDQKGIVSWLFGAMRNMTGDEFDALVAGPNRPPPLAQADEPSDVKGALDETMAAMHERGELAKTLAERTEDLEQHAGTMVEQARQLATKGKKSKFGF